MEEKYEEITEWGQNYDKDMNKLPETKWIPLKDLTTDHIEGILKFFKGRLYRLNPQTLEYFVTRILD